mmetsp:Transcript_2159/g.6377  ORF Transcript_2159/g.6377 Transcript_2159/m.6377 type:complete len:379 (-) Transcript_2159:210-1346(-)
MTSLRVGALTAQEPPKSVLQGGLFRKPDPRPKGKGQKRKRRQLPALAGLELGSLEDLRQASKGGQDPSGLGATQLATDVMWSDPVIEEGLQFNEDRGIGLMFGPDQTQLFLEANGLSLLLRSHEGPDARSRPGCPMPTMAPGYSVDHVVPAGRLMTVFSAPDYPQFQPVDDPKDRFNNLAAVAVLSGPDFATPVMKQFAAVKPRPMSEPFYDLGMADSDEEFEALPNGFESDMEHSCAADRLASPSPATEAPVSTGAATAVAVPRSPSVGPPEEHTVHWGSRNWPSISDPAAACYADPEGSHPASGSHPSTAREDRSTADPGPAPGSVAEPSGDSLAAAAADVVDGDDGPTDCTGGATPVPPPAVSSAPSSGAPIQAV